MFDGKFYWVFFIEISYFYWIGIDENKGLFEKYILMNVIIGLMRDV